MFALIAATNFARSLQEGAVSTNAPIFRLNFMITAALAIVLLGETLTMTKLAALVGALGAVWLLLAEQGARQGRSNLRSLSRVLIATVAMAFANLFYKVGLQQGALPETMVAAQAWAFCSTATLFGPSVSGDVSMAPASARPPRGGAVRGGRRAQPPLNESRDWPPDPLWKWP